MLKRDWGGARVPVVRGAVAEEFIKRLEAGQFRQARDAQQWIKKRTRKTLTESGVRKVLRRLGGKLKVARKKGSGQGGQVQSGAACETDRGGWTCAHAAGTTVGA